MHLDARRRQIVDAARARFATHGFARTSMTDLVEASGLSVGAIYRYFESKDQAVSPPLATLVRSQVEDLRAGIAALLPDHEPAKAEAAAEAFVTLCHGYGQQLAVRGDLDPAPYAAALLAIIDS
ncbi:helix-turn-helix domain-containing protein [Amycolatopsis sp. A133]|uniref:TetR/AcrR family transcriptional regulator n=1 Tax=Amycolatopsis sp. A133 TaxID=3064472 RepID=UPI0027F3FEC7|nr:helix-turn-helix domain-containing protein [Amycolatopsis sp. A133]MDQ7810811.1 helix-turn-helix domain-containing protein [Amycolatopsis sp. A133]